MINIYYKCVCIFIYLIINIYLFFISLFGKISSEKKPEWLQAVHAFVKIKKRSVTNGQSSNFQQNY